MRTGWQLVLFFDGVNAVLQRELSRKANKVIPNLDQLEEPIELKARGCIALHVDALYREGDYGKVEGEWGYALWSIIKRIRLEQVET